LKEKVIDFGEKLLLKHPCSYKDKNNSIKKWNIKENNSNQQKDNSKWFFN
jgi:hypothetical protein